MALQTDPNLIQFKLRVRKVKQLQLLLSAASSQTGDARYAFSLSHLSCVNSQHGVCVCVCRVSVTPLDMATHVHFADLVGLNGIFKYVEILFFLS